MNQISTTQAERISGLERFGYSEPEAAFLCLAALHGGYFLRRQYAQFLARQDGGTVTQLVQKALAKGHTRASTWRQNTQLYHLSSRPLYEALGQENNRNRRRRESSAIKNKVMGLDFVLSHPDHEYLATEQEKLNYFTGTLQLEKSVLPTKRYTSRGQITERHFVEKFPLFLSASAHPAAPPVVSFCFVDEGSAGLSGFGTFLHHYERLFAQLREFQVIYVAGPGGHFEAAGKAFARFLNRGCDTQVQVSLDPRAERILEHFEARHLYETQQWNSFDRSKLIRLRNERNEFSGPEIDLLYEQWKAQGRARGLENLRAKPGVAGADSRHVFDACFGTQLWTL